MTRSSTELVEGVFDDGDLVKLSVVEKEQVIGEEEVCEGGTPSTQSDRFPLGFHNRLGEPLHAQNEEVRGKGISLPDDSLGEKGRGRCAIPQDLHTR